MIGDFFIEGEIEIEGEIKMDYNTKIKAVLIGEADTKILKAKLIKLFFPL